jgi:hypothetical protein
MPRIFNNDPQSARVDVHHAHAGKNGNGPDGVKLEMHLTIRHLCRTKHGAGKAMLRPLQASST